MRKIALAVLIAFSVAGCANFQNAWQALTSATVSPTAVIISGYSFNAIEATATNYLTRPRCTGSNGPICRSPAVTKELGPAVLAARAARSSAEQFLIDHPGQLGSQGLYDAMIVAGNTLKAILDKYNIGVQL